MSFRETLEQINNFDLADIDWSRAGVWPLSGRIAVIVLLLAAVFLSTYFLFIKDMQASLEREVNREQSLRSEFRGKAFQAATLAQHRELMQKMEGDFAALVNQLPKKTQVPGLLDDIDEKGRMSGLNIASIRLLPEVKGEFYITLPIEIVVSGSYHNLGTFVSGVAGMPRIVTLHDFSIKRGKGASDLTMKVKAQTYRSLDEEGVQ